MGALKSTYTSGLRAVMGTVPLAWFCWMVALVGWAKRTVPGLPVFMAMAPG